MSTGKREAVQLLLEKQVDGLIVSPAAIEHADCLSHAIASQCPVVQVVRVVRGLETDAVLLDNVGSAHHAVTQLIDAGHRRIGIVAELVGASPKDISTFVRTMKPKLPLSTSIQVGSGCSATCLRIAKQGSSGRVAGPQGEYVLNQCRKKRNGGTPFANPSHCSVYGGRIDVDGCYDGNCRPRSAHPQRPLPGLLR